MTELQTGLDFQIEEAVGRLVTVRLMTIHYIPSTSGGIGNSFILEMIVSNGTVIGDFEDEQIISPFGQLNVNQYVFTADDIGDINPINFFFSARSGPLYNNFNATATEQDLSPGVNQFMAPVILTAPGRESRIEFRGRIDVT